jgi:hypothetical protein
MHASEGIIEAPVVLALGVNAEVQALNSTYDVFEHTIGFKCCSYLGLPDNPIGLIKIASESYH